MLARLGQDHQPPRGRSALPGRQGLHPPVRLEQPLREDRPLLRVGVGVGVAQRAVLVGRNAARLAS